MAVQDLLARGMTFSPSPRFGTLFGGRRDLTFGIYGRADAARDLLQEKWSGMPLQDGLLGIPVSLEYLACCKSSFCNRYYLSLCTEGCSIDTHSRSREAPAGVRLFGIYNTMRMCLTHSLA